MEGVHPVRHRWEVLGWFLIVPVTITMVLVLTASAAWAGDPGGQYSSNPQTSASATVSGGTISVQAGNQIWTPPAGGAQPSGPSVSSGKSEPPPTTDCKYVVPPASTQQSLGAGGPTPGEWVFPVSCGGPSITNPAAPFWVTNAQAAAAPLVVNPAALAQQALSRLTLTTPAIQMAPPAGSDQLVNVSTWLWVDAGAWQQQSANATAGPVTATATASPAEVVWQMGDGQSVTCSGPGTPFDPSAPNATTNCSYTWTQSSAGQPGGVYQVTATVYYRAAWTATGAPGGGNLGLVAGPTAHVAVAVAQSEAINNAPGS